MVFRKIHKNLKAISPVISVLLMVAIAVVASLVAYAWIMGYMNFTTDKTGKSIQIQSIANIHSQSGEEWTTHIWVQNIGSNLVELNENSVYVDGAMSYLVPGEGQNDQLGDPVPPKATVELVIYSVAIQKPITFKVVAADGTFSQVTQTISNYVEVP